MYQYVKPFIYIPISLYRDFIINKLMPNLLHTHDIFNFYNEKVIL